MDTSWTIEPGSAAAAILVAYLIGSIPFGLILTRLAGVGDIRNIGSGNIGATNVLRTGRKGLAAATLALDAAKGAIAVLGGGWILGADATLLTAVAVVVGHMFPVWLGFKGGKGVATGWGALTALAWPAGLVAVGIWILMAVLFRYSSLSALAASASAPLLIWMFAGPRAAVAALIVAVLVWIRHAPNIRRLLKGEESRINLRKKG